jgi:hypothetical protein
MLTRRFGFVMAALLACSGSEPSDAQWKDRGAAALEPFKERLQGALRDGLAQGTEQAIDACRLRAPALAAEAGSPTVQLGRTSHKLRNPDNAPRPWVRPLLDAYLANPADPRPRVVGLPAGRVGYVEPIYVQPMCLACHGESLAPAVKSRIDRLYPGDRAVGFREGDVRGLFWVELSQERSASGEP